MQKLSANPYLAGIEERPMKSTALLILLTFPLLSISPAGAVTFDWATIGDHFNDYDTHLAGYGGVDYTYRIGKHEVTNAQYTEFLNAVDPTGANALRLYNNRMSDNISVNSRTGRLGGIENTGTVDGARYIAQVGLEQNPVNFVSFFDAMRFVNWLHNGQGSGDTESGAYTIGNGLDEDRSTDAKFWIPSEDEWYKAAYYDPTSGVYYDYPTGTDTPPRSATPGTNNTNVANFNRRHAIFNGHLTDVGAYSLAVSPYGTFDQGGNVSEWTEGFSTDFCCRILRGGSWNLEHDFLQASSGLSRSNGTPTGEQHYWGFRVAGVPGRVGDCHGDGILDAADLSCVSSVEARDAVLDALNALPGDLDGNGEVAFADFLVLSANFGTGQPSYADGNIDLNDGISFEDFLVLAGNFGKAPSGLSAVPEPTSFVAAWLGLLGLAASRRPRTR